MALAKKPFVVLDAEILSSSVWSESATVRLVWITLLILCDTDGYVGASIPGIATAAGVERMDAEAAIKRLQEPDPYSRTRTNEGRRVEQVERGWRILNFRDHLDRLSSERTKARDRVRRHRERNAMKRALADSPVTVLAENREQGIGRREKRKEQTNINGLSVAMETSVIDAYNEVFGTKLANGPGNIKAARRALAEGYTIEAIRTVFEAVRDNATQTAKWCNDTNREFEYLIRPTYKKAGEPVMGPIDKIQNELQTGRS